MGIEAIDMWTVFITVDFRQKMTAMTLPVLLSFIAHVTALTIWRLNNKRTPAACEGCRRPHSPKVRRLLFCDDCSSA
jgi:hypothetical protein